MAPARYWSALISFKARRRVAVALEPRVWLRDIGGRRALHSPTVFGVTWPQLGDHWVALSHFARILESSSCPHSISVISENWAAPGAQQERRRALLQEISEVFGIADRIDITHAPPERYLPPHPDRAGKTREIPTPPDTEKKFIAWQFGARTYPQLNPTPEQQERFLGLFPADTLREVGLPMTLSECVGTLQQSRALIAVSSGMSHIAASVNVPTLLFIPPQKDWRSELEMQKHHLRWNPYPNTRFFRNSAELRRHAIDLGLIATG